MKRNLWVPVAVGLLLTVLFYFLGAFLSGGGHSLVAMTVFFPYGLATGISLGDGTFSFIEVVLLALQFPVYALILANVKGGWRWAAVLILLAAHVVAAVIAMRVYRASKGEVGSGGMNVPQATRYSSQALSLEGAFKSRRAVMNLNLRSSVSAVGCMPFLCKVNAQLTHDLSETHGRGVLFGLNLRPADVLISQP